MTTVSTTVLDSSGWIAVLRGEPNARVFAEALTHPDQVVVPMIIAVEVARHLVRWATLENAEAAMAWMGRCQLVPLSPELALESASIGIRHRLPLADSIIYATAQAHDAELWTQDVDFDGLPGVRYFARP